MSGWSTEPKLMEFVKSITDRIDEFRNDSNNNWTHALYWIGLHTMFLEEEDKHEKDQDRGYDRGMIEWALRDKKYLEKVRRNLKLGIQTAESNLKRNQIDLEYLEAREKEINNVG